MSRRQKEWAIRARKRLMERMGAICVHCGSREELTFDCIYPLGDSHHRMESSSRMSFYHEQERNCNLQVLCNTCNIRKGDFVTDDSPDLFAAAKGDPF